MGTGRIFINYRREDSRADSGRIYDSLSLHFPGKIFRDVGSLQPGVDWQQAIGLVLSQSDACVVVIGCNWLNIKGDDGNRRLDDPRDTVRREVFAALERNMRVFPVLVGGAKMPKESELPPDLKPLCDRNALEMTEQDWEECCVKLARALETAVAPAQPSATPIRVTEKRSAAPILLLALGTVAIVGAAFVVFSINRRPNVGYTAQMASSAPASPERVTPQVRSQQPYESPAIASAGVPDQLGIQPAPIEAPRARSSSPENLAGRWRAQVTTNGSLLDDETELYQDHSFLVRMNGTLQAIGHWQADGEGRLRLTDGKNFTTGLRFRCSPLAGETENGDPPLEGSCSDQMNDTWTFAMSREVGNLETPAYIAPGRVDVSQLTMAERSAFNQVLATLRCTCPCGMTVAMCLRKDLTCNFSPAIARNALMNFLRSARG